MNICPKTHQNAPFKKFSRRNMPPNPPSKRLASQDATRHATRPAPKNLAPLANPAYAHELLLRKLFEEMHS